MNNSINFREIQCYISLRNKNKELHLNKKVYYIKDSPKLTST